MFVDLLKGCIFEGLIGAVLGLSLFNFVESGPVLDDFDADELFQDPALRRVKRKFGLFRLQSLVHCHHAIELFDIGAGVKRHPFNQLQNRGGAIAWWRGHYPGNLPFALLGRSCEAGLLPHQNFSHSARLGIAPQLEVSGTVGVLSVGPSSALASALAQTEGTGSRLSLARMASAGLVQVKGLGSS